MWHQATGAGRADWVASETPFEVDLYDGALTPEGAYAVGEGGTIVADRGNGWHVAVEGAPATEANQVRAMDATSDGERLWMVGADGQLACYDVSERELFEYAYPDEMPSVWDGIAISGDAGEEKGIAADGRGGILPFSVDEHDVDWGKVGTPNEDERIDALAASPDGIAYAIDTGDEAYKTTIKDGWSEAGVVSPDTEFLDLDAWENERVYVSADDGCLYRYENDGDDWIPLGVTDGGAVRAIDLHDQGDDNAQMCALCDDGALYERTGPERWERTPLPTDARLFDVSLGSPDLVVGENGTVLERERSEAATARDVGPSSDDPEDLGWESVDEGDDADAPDTDADGDETDATDGDDADEPDAPDRPDS
jgi:hypothetical protein